MRRFSSLDARFVFFARDTRKHVADERAHKGFQPVSRVVTQRFDLFIPLLERRSSTRVASVHAQTSRDQVHGGARRAPEHAVQSSEQRDERRLRLSTAGAKFERRRVFVCDFRGEERVLDGVVGANRPERASRAHEHERIVVVDDDQGQRLVRARPTLRVRRRRATPRLGDSSHRGVRSGERDERVGHGGVRLDTERGARAVQRVHRFHAASRYFGSQRLGDGSNRVPVEDAEPSQQFHRRAVPSTAVTPLGEPVRLGVARAHFSCSMQPIDRPTHDFRGRFAVVVFVHAFERRDDAARGDGERSSDTLGSLYG